MAELKTKKTGASVKEFLDGIADEAKRADAKTLDRIIRNTTGEKPKMWGAAIVGYGDTTLTYASGREIEWMVLGFSPRSANLTLYLPKLTTLGALFKKLGPHKLGKGCLYVKRLADVDAAVLTEIIAKAYS
jgi:hypothetical protein